jgi:hypothetical protein
MNDEVERSEAVRCLADHAAVILVFEEGTQTLAHDWMFVRQNRADHGATSRWAGSMDGNSTAALSDGTTCDSRLGGQGCGEPRQGSTVMRRFRGPTKIGQSGVDVQSRVGMGPVISLDPTGQGPLFDSMSISGRPDLFVRNVSHSGMRSAQADWWDAVGVSISNGTLPGSIRATA